MFCQLCGLLHVSPMPAQDELFDFYQNYSKTDQYLGKLASKLKRAKKRIRIASLFRQRTTFLDVGCNAGFAVEAARQLGYDAFGIDIDPVAIAHAKKQYPECQFDVASIEELAENRSKFDFIYCSEVIEHLPNLSEFVPAIKSALSPNGLLFITTPDIGHYSLPKDLMSWDGIKPPEHLLYFTKKSLTQTFSNYGFSSIRCTFNFKPTIKAIIKI